MRRQQAATRLLVCASAAALAACGSSGSKTVSKAEIISKGDAICRKATSQITASPPNGDPAQATSAQLKASAPFFQQLSNSTRTSVSQIAALGKPDKDAALLDKLLANGRTSAANSQAAGQAAQRGDVKAFRVAFAKRQGGSGSALAKQFGFKVCAQRG
jgi:hypothetical protein